MRSGQEQLVVMKRRNEMERVIRVTGKGKIVVHPDTTRLFITIEGNEKEYGEAIRKSTKSTNLVKDIAADLGFDRMDLKTVSMNVEPRYEGYQDEKRNWKNRFAGYQYHHRMKLQFPLNNELLGRLLYALAHCEANPELNLEYTISNQENCKNDLLREAVTDSAAKARILAEASDVELGEIQLVDYSWNKLDLVTRPVNRMAAEVMCRKADAETSYDMDMTPDDIEVEDTVTVVWGIR